jgi:hypothetical protein
MSAATPTETVHNPDHGTSSRSPLLESLADLQRNTSTSLSSLESSKQVNPAPIVQEPEP